ncbi:MAG TPA: hypothetical protein VFQ40_01430 [Actinomycetota bacterium]|nr:hypothetical protein [Actinomycetota bacterium]
MTDRAIPRGAVPLLFASMAIFVVTVTMGILNGTDLVDLPHGALLAHVHSGTLGWITLSIFAAAAWIVGSDAMPRLLRDGAIVAVVLYVAAFWIDVKEIRPFAGALMLAAIVWFAIWVVRTRAGGARTVPGLAIVLAAINLVIGGFLGVILGLAHAGVFDISSELAGAHPAMMVVGYLILAGVAIDEQLVGGPGTERLTRLGAWQAYLFFGAGIALVLGILFDLQPLLGLNLVGEVVGVAFGLTRLRREILGAGWASPGPARFGAVSILWLVPVVGMIVYLIANYIEDFEAVPVRLLLALDHATFVGILTNAILGLLLVATANRRTVWAWADQLVFWGVNLGLVGFVIGLIGDAPVLKRISTPVMGLAILLGLLTAAMRLRRVGVEQVPATARAEPRSS